MYRLIPIALLLLTPGVAPAQFHAGFGGRFGGLPSLPVLGGPGAFIPMPYYGYQRSFMVAYAGGYGRKNERRGHMGRMHKSIVDGKVILLESWIQQADAEIGGQAIKKGSWLQSVLVPDDELWAQVKKGDLTGFSIGGLATRVKRD